MKYFCSLFLLFFLTVTVMAQPLVRRPAISPDGELLAFSYQGDIWTVPLTGGRAFRLTIHEGYESMPIWSQDGSRLIFPSDRFGNMDIFSVSASGGTPTRHTYHSGSDVPYSIMKDGSVLFTTNRIYSEVEREDEIYRIPASGGTPVRFMDALGFDPVVSPDGTKVAFVRGTCRIDREAYQGPANRDIWIYDRSSDSYMQLTKYDGNDFNPLWLDDNTLTYLSAKSGKYNVHKISLDGTDTQLTNNSDFGVFSYSISPASERLVYQSGHQVMVHEMNTGSERLIEIDVAGDYRFDRVVAKTIKNGVDEMAISPNGKYAAYVERGEVFVTRNDKEDMRSVNLSNHVARESDVEWLNDENLLFLSDREGQYDIYLVRSADPDKKNLFKTLKRETIRLTNTAEEETYINVSPDGRQMVIREGWGYGSGKLMVADISATGALSGIKTLVEGWNAPDNVVWSPDNSWLAYAQSDLNFNQEVFIHAADGSKAAVNVSMHPKYDGNPVWSPDGSKLGFISQRNNGDNDVWFVWLKKSDWEKSQDEWKREELEDDKDEKNEKDDQASEDRSVEIKIDFNRIYERLEQVTAFAGGENDFAFDAEGTFIYYATGRDWRRDHKVESSLYKIKWDGSENEEIKGFKGPGGLVLGPKKEYLYVLTDGGTMKRLALSGDKEETLSVTSKLEVDYPAELEQLFEEGWRALNAGFYDPEFHGRNWTSLKTSYKPLALSASTKEDFQYVFNLMLGQLNASHMGMYRGENQKETQEQQTGLLGVEGENVNNGFRITKILPGSPADRTESRLLVGDVIRSVNAQNVNASTNFFHLMEGTRGEQVLLQVLRGKSVEDVVIWPVSSLRSALYDNWVNECRKLVEEYSAGRLGYLHIQGMNWTSFERFERELMAAGYGKDGILIDVRYNGGGWTTDYLMAVLTVRQHAYTVPRGATESLQNHTKYQQTYPFGERLPLVAWTKPSIALCNADSYSNAEIFSHAYKTLDLGTLVGQPTFGAVISTGGMTLQDGSLVRMPFRAWYVKATGENMEHGPAVPDILVENPPAYKAKGVDPQLKRAVDELLKQL